MAKQWETKHGLARRNDQLEGYLEKKVQRPYYPLLWHEKFAILTRLEVCNDIGVTVPALLLDPDKPRDQHMVNLVDMLEAKCIGGRQFVISMPDRQYFFKAKNDEEAAVWVACIIDTQSRSTWYVEQINLKTPFFSNGDNYPDGTLKRGDFEERRRCTLTLRGNDIVIRDVLSGQEMGCISYDTIHSFESDHCLLWVVTCACAPGPASLRFFVVTTGETACLALVHELKDIMVRKFPSYQVTLLPIDAKARHIATVAVGGHAKCAFPQHRLVPSSLGRILSQGLLPLCNGLMDLLCITRRTGNSALMCGYVPRDYIERYPPKGTRRCLRCAAENVHAPPLFALSQASYLHLPMHTPEGTKDVASDTYPLLSSLGACAVGISSDARDSYVPMRPVDMLTYLELLPESLPLGPLAQLQGKGTVTDNRELEVPEEGELKDDECVSVPTAGAHTPPLKEVLPDTVESDA